MSSTDTKQPTCAERISEHMEGRLSDFRDLVAVASDPDSAGSGPKPTAVDRLYDAGEIDSPLTNELEELQEQAQERIHEYPLAVSTYQTHRIDISTGGPADWLEVTADGDDITSIRYHFADWFDHAERTLEGDDFDHAAGFARALIPELS